MRRARVWDADRLQAALNIAGAAAFAVGSVLFFDRSLAPLGVGLFVLGSFGMLVGALAVWRTRYAPVRRRAADPGAVVAAPLTSPATPDSSPGSPPGD